MLELTILWDNFRTKTVNTFIRCAEKYLLKQWKRCIDTAEDKMPICKLILSYIVYI